MQHRFPVTLLAIAVFSGCAQQQLEPIGPEVCAGPFELAIVLLYPEPNATSVPTAASYLILGAIPSEFGLATKLVPVGSASPGTPLLLGAFGPAPSPLPSPIAVSFTGHDYGVAYPQLASQTTYEVEFTASSSGPCAPEPSPAGRFTTQ